jgi:hypothetical protein
MQCTVSAVYLEIRSSEEYGGALYTWKYGVARDMGAPLYLEVRSSEGYGGALYTWKYGVASDMEGPSIPGSTE